MVLQKKFLFIVYIIIPRSVLWTIFAIFVDVMVSFFNLVTLIVLSLLSLLLLHTTNNNSMLARTGFLLKGRLMTDSDFLLVSVMIRRLNVRT